MFSCATIARSIMSSFKNPAWLPFSVSEAASAGDATGQDLDSGQAWNHLLDTLKRTGDVVLSDSVPHDPVDMASGFRHLLVLLGVGIDELLRRGLDQVPAVKPSGMDAAYKWGMECPDCIYVGSALKGGSPTGCGATGARHGTWDCRSWRGWGPPPTP